MNQIKNEVDKMKKWNLILTIGCRSKLIAESVLKDAKEALHKIYGNIIITGKVIEAVDFTNVLDLINRGK